MLSTLTIIWMYLVGVWIFYEATSQSAYAEDVDLEMDFLGGIMLLSWPISFPVMYIWAFFAASNDDE